MSFDENVYAAIREGSRASAAVVVPRILAEYARPRGAPDEQPKTGLQVLDVGAGEGWWSAEFARHGIVAEVISIDDHASNPSPARVNVQRLDLERGAATSLVGEPFDVVVCLEVAEHLTPAGGDELVALLCSVTTPTGIIAFSAAIPCQGGHKHLNEQWPSYWDARFRANGWRLSDPLRESLWDDDRVEPWYRQNLLIAVSPAANGTAWAAGGSPRGLVHPMIWQWRLEDRDHWREQYLACDRNFGKLLAQAGGTP